MVTKKIKEVASDQLTDKTRKRNVIVFESTSIQISSSMQPVQFRSIFTGRFSDICPSRIELAFSRYKAESGAKWAHFSLRRPRYLNAWKRLESNISDKTENKDFNVKILRVSLVG